MERVILISIAFCTVVNCRLASDFLHIIGTCVSGPGHGSCCHQRGHSAPLPNSKVRTTSEAAESPQSRGTLVTIFPLPPFSHVGNCCSEIKEARNEPSPAILKKMVLLPHVYVIKQKSEKFNFQRVKYLAVGSMVSGREKAGKGCAENPNTAAVSLPCCKSKYNRPKLYRFRRVQTIFAGRMKARKEVHICIIHLLLPLQYFYPPYKL